MSNRNRITRREMLAASAAAVSSIALGATWLSAEQPATAATEPTSRPWSGPIIDIHQHTTYHARSDAAMLHHQKRMGITQTILLPAGRPTDALSTLKGKANGLYAGAGTIDTVLPVVKAHPNEYFFMANEVPDVADARESIEKYLKQGAKGIGEQKFNLPVDSKEMEALYELAQEFQVPILMHFQFETFNTGYERFGKVLEKWHKVTFIGHAQTFWAHIDKEYKVQTNLYPKGKVTPGGLTDRYLSDHPNFFADMSAGSGLNALIRDEDHAKSFIERHQNQMLYGSDCADSAGFGPTCTGAQMISAIVRLSPDDKVTRKLLYENAKTLFKM